MLKLNGLYLKGVGEKKKKKKPNKNKKFDNPNIRSFTLASSSAVSLAVE